MLLSIRAGTTVVLSLKNKTKNQNWAFDFVYEPLKPGFIYVYPWKAYSLSILTKAGFRVCKFICQFPNLGQFSWSPLSNLTVWNWSFLSWRHMDSLCHPPRPVASGSNHQCINAGTAGTQPVVHGSLPTGQIPRRVPELNEFLLRFGTLSFYFWLKHFSHFIVLFEIKHSCNFWVLTVYQALC